MYIKFIFVYVERGGDDNKGPFQEEGSIREEGRLQQWQNQMTFTLTFFASIM